MMTGKFKVGYMVKVTDPYPKRFDGAIGIISNVCSECYEVDFSNAEKGWTYAEEELEAI